MLKPLLTCGEERPFLGRRLRHPLLPATCLGRTDARRILISLSSGAPTPPPGARTRLPEIETQQDARDQSEGEDSGSESEDSGSGSEDSGASPMP